MGAGDHMDLVQWPAMLAIVVASWLVGSQRPDRRKTAFLGFIVGNVMWVAWGLYVEAYALALLDVMLCGMNIRGFLKNRGATERSASDAP
jgi:hypothetical protein